MILAEINYFFRVREAKMHVDSMVEINDKINMKLAFYNGIYIHVVIIDQVVMQK